MPVKRKRAIKERLHRITPEAVAAYREGNYMRLHRALGLMPWQCRRCRRRLLASASIKVRALHTWMTVTDGSRRKSFSTSLRRRPSFMDTS